MSHITDPNDPHFSHIKQLNFEHQQPGLTPQKPSPRHFYPMHMHAEDIDDLKHLIVGSLVTPVLFDLARTKAVQTGVSLDCLLLQEGLMNEEVYVRLLAQTVGVSYLPPQQSFKLNLQFDDGKKINRRFERAYYETDDGFALVPFGAGGMGPLKLKAFLQKFVQEIQFSHSSVQQVKLYFVSPTTVRDGFQSQFSDQLLFRATESMAITDPLNCAKSGLSGMQTAGLITALPISIYGVWTSPQITFFALSAFFSFFFFCLIFFRFIIALKFHSISKLFKPSTHPLPRNHPLLPVYTLLVPLFRETAVLPQLIAALEELDYPKAKLDIKLLLEAIDTSTIEAVRAMNLPPYFHVVIVPDGQPRTKPKALNYGLQLAQGDYVVIYDAEDIPDQAQLRRALEAFHNSSFNCAVIQAKLNFYNQKQNWLTKQFTMEYSSLFDGVLPAYFKFSFPLPLGGTSNHFRKEALDSIGGWDPYNVTEDADLGMRFYRRGYTADILGSSTYEEACSRLSCWLYQRTRWLKGWMQTYYVHMRRPFTLWRELGAWKFIGFQLIIGAPIAAALIHPLFLGLLVWSLSIYGSPDFYDTLLLWWISLFNLTIGYFATMWLGAQALHFRRTTGFLFTILSLPLYWIFISFAAYRALFQLIHAPFYWEKTDHKGQISH